MKMSLAASIVTAALFCTSLPALADPSSCRQVIAGYGKHTRVAGSTDWKRHGGQVPPRLGFDRAIAAWQSQVKARCPHYSSNWMGALQRKVVCEGKLGGETCTATARPARKNS